MGDDEDMRVSPQKGDGPFAATSSSEALDLCPMAQLLGSSLSQPPSPPFHHEQHHDNESEFRYRDLKNQTLDMQFRRSRRGSFLQN